MSETEMQVLRPIEWLPRGAVRFLDQTRLPQEEIWAETADWQVVAEGIRQLRLRGAPLIGIAAAYALSLAALADPEGQPGPLLAHLRATATALAATRPTAVNLTWALDRMLAAAEGALDTADTDAICRILVDEACRIHQEDIAANRQMGALGAALLPRSASVLTHCNTGSLATGGYGTALGVIRAAWEQGKLRQVYATETRPLLQGARLTAWELARDNIPFTLLVDSAAGSLLQRRQVDAVIVGADRIAANGDVANKIGTYPLAVLARENGVPFYVAAPTSTIDLATPWGEAIPIEERGAQEVTTFGGRWIAPEGVQTTNPAFDVTPHRFIAAIITERGVVEPPYQESLGRLDRVRVIPRA